MRLPCNITKGFRWIRSHGRIHTDRQWKVLSKLKNGYQDSLFTSPTVARNVAAPLVKYIDKVLVADRVSAPKVTVLVGHDSNIASLLTARILNPISSMTSMRERRLAASLSSNAGMTATLTGI